MGLILPPKIEVSQVQHLPIVKAYADKIGLVEVIKQVVSTEMAIAPGTIVLGMILDTLSGRRPLYRLEECFAQQDTARLLGKAVAPEAFHLTFRTSFESTTVFSQLDFAAEKSETV